MQNQKQKWVFKKEGETEIGKTESNLRHADNVITTTENMLQLQELLKNSHKKTKRRI